MKFDLSKIKISKKDLERGLILPKETSVELMELVGIHYGDGSLCKDARYDYNISYSGNLKEDEEYIEYISQLFLKLFNIKLKKIIDRNRNSIVLRCRSKTLFYFYTEYLKIPSGTKKDLLIPYYVRNNKKFLLSFLRGLFDTDGCVTIQEMGKYSYPLAKIATKHKNFAKDIVKGLNLLTIPSFLTIKKSRGFVGYEVVVRNKNIRNFFEVIGSKNPRNFKKFKKFVGVNGDAGI